jgi:hypothetical protein
VFIDVGGARKFYVSSRSLVLIVALFSLLLASVIWNFWQYRLIEHHRMQVLAIQRAVAAHAEMETEQAGTRMKKKAETDAADQRVQQLYREIDNLSRINEQLLSQPQRQQSAPRKISGLEETVGIP